MTRKPPFDRDHLPPGVDPPGRGDPERLGDYRVVGRIGAGGMGAVYAGVTDTGQSAAVKVIHSQFAADPEFRARFAREVGMVSRVRATCAPAFLGADVQAATPWLATEYVPGPTLRQYVKRHGPLAGGALTALAVGLAEALTAIHSVGVVHRDLKPGNVILAPDGPKVLDFGIARAADGTVLTATGGLHGTPGWVAPEQYEGVQATGYSDMFAWGGMVAVAATGRDPFGRGDVTGVIHRSRHEEPDLEGVPEHLMDLVRRSLAKDPGERPRADEALAELTRGWSATRIVPDEAPSSTRVEESGREVLPTEVVPELLATEWRGVVEDPGTRRVRGPRRALMLSATAAVLVVALVGGLLFFDRLPWGNQAPEGGVTNQAGEGSAGEGSGGPMVQDAPEDGVAVVTEAMDLMAAAPDFLYRHEYQADREQGDPSISITEYTEEPVRAVQLRHYHPFATLITLHKGDDLDDEIHALIRGEGEDPEPEYYRTDNAANAGVDLLGHTDWGLEWVVDTDSEVEYQGHSRVPYEPEFLDGGVSEGLVFEETEGHLYSGTFAYEDEREEIQVTNATFDLWIDDEGYPLRLSVSGVEVPVNPDHQGTSFTELRDYVFHESRDIYIPEESEILPDHPDSA